MGKYLLEITRATRAERPSEATIEADTVLVFDNGDSNTTQDLAKDNYFRIIGDYQEQLFRILSTMEFNPAKLLAGNGWRIKEYPHYDKWTNATAARDGAEIQVQYTQESTGGTNVYTGATAWADAQAFIATLSDSDGYVLIDELNGDTQVVNSRPSLWKKEGEMHCCIGVKHLVTARNAENDRY